MAAPSRHRGRVRQSLGQGRICDARKNTGGAFVVFSMSMRVDLESPQDASAQSMSKARWPAEQMRVAGRTQQPATVSDDEDSPRDARRKRRKLSAPRVFSGQASHESLSPPSSDFSSATSLSLPAESRPIKRRAATVSDDEDVWGTPPKRRVSLAVAITCKTRTRTRPTTIQTTKYRHREQ